MVHLFNKKIENQFFFEFDDGAISMLIGEGKEGEMRKTWGEYDVVVDKAIPMMTILSFSDLLS